MATRDGSATDGYAPNLLYYADNPGLLRNSVRFAAALTLLVLAAGCHSGEKSARAGFIVSTTGQIGDLRIDESDRAAVIAFAGRPDAERHGRESLGSAPYDALGYGCGRKLIEKSYPLVTYPEGPPYCRTAFWIDARSGRLENFFTGDARYSEAHGVRIGMPTSRAERLLRKRLSGRGCEDNLYFVSPTARLTIAFTGGVSQRTKLRLIGGHVFAFVLHSRRRDAGVFDCM